MDRRWIAIVAAGVAPDFSSVGASSRLAAIVGALLTLVLIVSVLMLLVCAAAWGIASAAGNYQSALRARTGMFIALGAAVLAGGGVTWTNFLLRTGAAL